VENANLLREEREGLQRRSGLPQEEKLKTTDKVLEIIAKSDEPVTLKFIQNLLGIKPGAVSGTLVFLFKTGKITREKIERSSGTGPKQQWCYKIVDTSEKTQ